MKIHYWKSGNKINKTTPASVELNIEKKLFFKNIRVICLERNEVK